MVNELCCNQLVAIYMIYKLMTTAYFGLFKICSFVYCFSGIILTLLVYRVDLQHFKLSHCVAASVVMPTSCIVTFYFLKWCGLDPQWSISLATKYCANPDWIHLDTTLFNAVYRDAGSVLGEFRYKLPLYLVFRLIDFGLLMDLMFYRRQANWI